MWKPKENSIGAERGGQMPPLLTDLLNDIRAKPGCYIGGHAIEQLGALLRGYQMAQAELGVRDTLLDKFQGWIAARFECRISRSWDAIIRFNSVNEREAMQYCWELLDEFLASREVGSDVEPAKTEE